MHAVRIGVDALGLIFYAKSKRCVSLAQAQRLVNTLPPFITLVAVLVNPEVDFVHELIRNLPLQLLQFHGDETPEFCQQFALPYVKAIHPRDGQHIRQQMQAFHQAQALLLDTPSSDSRGGGGIAFDWRIIPANLPKPYILSGGLNELNINDALNRCQPYAVDLCSGIEAEPGIKNHGTMSRFMQAIRSYHDL